MCVILPVTLPNKDEATTCRLLQRFFYEECGANIKFLPVVGDPIQGAAEDSDIDMALSKLEIVVDQFPVGCRVLYYQSLCTVNRVYETNRGIFMDLNDGNAVIHVNVPVDKVTRF